MIKKKKKFDIPIHGSTTGYQSELVYYITRY